MAIPNTTGVLCTDLASMQIGDYIPCTYTATSGAFGTFSNLGVNSGTEILITGSATPNGLFYFLKVDKGLLISDRVIQVSINWDTLNTGKYIEGKIVTLNSKDCLIRSLSGGCAYADANGNSSTTDKSLGAFPVNNEYDKYIVGSDLGGKIIKGEDNVWHWSLASWCKDTGITGVVGGNGATSTNTTRTLRGYSTYGVKGYNNFTTTSVYVSTGFRPVLEYLEPNTKSTTIFF